MLIHAQMGAYACMDRCLVTRVDGCLCMHGRVFVHEYTGVCTWVCYMHGRALGHIITSK